MRPLLSKLLNAVPVQLATVIVLVAAAITLVTAGLYRCITNLATE